MDRALSPAVKRKKMRKRLLRLAVAGIAVAAAVLILNAVLENSLDAEQLTIAAADRGAIEISIGASGKLTPLTEEIIVSPISSRILETYRNPGDSVEAGEPLLRLELASVETEYKQKLDEYEMMKSKLVQTEVRLENTISELEMQQQVKQMQLRQLETDLRSEKYLDSIGAGTPDKMRRAGLNYEEAKLQLAQLGQKIDNERKNAAAEQRVQQLELSIFEKTLAEKARLLNDARILSPRKATLTYINNQIGAQVTQGAQVAIVADLTRFKAEAEIADGHREKLSVGSKTVIRTGGVELAGTVVNIKPSVANGVVQFTVVPEQSDHPGLRSGLSVDIHVLCGLRQNVLRLPYGDYYKYGPGTYSLWVVHDGQARKREVSLGRSGYDFVEVLDGLKEGERVILSDMDRYAKLETIRIDSPIK